MQSKHGHKEVLYLGASKGVLFRDDKEYPVYMVNGTKFGIQWGGLFATRDSLKAIDKFIGKCKDKINGRKKLKVFMPRRFDDEEFKVYEAVEWKENDKVVMTNGKAIEAKYSELYVYDAKIAAELKAADAKIAEAEAVVKKLRNERSRVKDKLVRVHRYDFEEAVKKYGVESKS